MYIKLSPRLYDCGELMMMNSIVKSVSSRRYGKSRAFVKEAAKTLNYGFLNAKAIFDGEPLFRFHPY